VAPAYGTPHRTRSATCRARGRRDERRASRETDGQLEESLPGRVVSSLYAPGKRVAYGVPLEDVDGSTISDDDERARRRTRAAEAQTNIDEAERERRRTVGTIGMLGTGLYAGGLLASRACPSATCSLQTRACETWGRLGTGTWTVPGSSQ
jgi:hypothetical protein